MVLNAIATAEGNLTLTKNKEGKIEYVFQKWVYGHIDPGNGVFNIGLFSLQLPHLTRKSTDDRNTFDPQLTKRQNDLLNQNQDLISKIEANVKAIKDKFAYIEDIKTRIEAINKAFEDPEFIALSKPLVLVANEYHTESLKKATLDIMTRAEKLGLKLTVRQITHLLDAYNQSPSAVFDQGGAIDLIENIEKEFQIDKTPATSILFSRVLSYSGKGGKWEGFTDYFNFIRDQDRRMLEIDKVLHAEGYGVFGRESAPKIGDYLKEDSNLGFTTVSGFDAGYRASQAGDKSRNAAHSDIAPLTKYFVDSVFEGEMHSAAYFILPGTIVNIQDKIPSNAIDSQTGSAKKDVFNDFGPDGSFANRTVVKVDIPSDYPESLQAYKNLEIHYLHLPQGLSKSFKVGDKVMPGQVFTEPNTFSGSGDGGAHFSIGIGSGGRYIQGDSLFSENAIATRNITSTMVMVDKKGLSWTLIPLQNVAISQNGEVKTLTSLFPDLAKEFNFGIKDHLAKPKK